MPEPASPNPDRGFLYNGCSLAMDPHSDKDHLTELFREHAPRVLRYALRQGLTQQEAEDVVEETFLVACRRLGELSADPLPWLLVVAKNAIADVKRGARRRQATIGRLRDEAHGHASFDPVERLYEPASVTRDPRFRRALARLSPPEREALLLVVWDDLSTKNAARVAGCTYVAFTLRLHRARKKLVKEFDMSGH